MNPYVAILHDWQELAAGILALLGGAAALGPLLAQILIERHRHRDAMKRKALVARAQMPDALAALSQFAKATRRWFRATMPAVAPEPPSVAINTLKAAIEFVDNVTAQQIFELVSFYQVHNSRYFDPRSARIGPEATERLYDSAKLQCLVNRLFKFARNQAKQAPSHEPTKEEMIGALRDVTEWIFHDTPPDDFDAASAIIERRHHD